VGMTKEPFLTKTQT